MLDYCFESARVSQLSTSLLMKQIVELSISVLAWEGIRSYFSGRNILSLTSRCLTWCCPSEKHTCYLTCLIKKVEQSLMYCWIIHKELCTLTWVVYQFPWIGVYQLQIKQMTVKVPEDTELLFIKLTHEYLYVSLIIQSCSLSYLFSTVSQMFLFRRIPKNIGHETE